MTSFTRVDFPLPFYLRLKIDALISLSLMFRSDCFKLHRIWNQVWFVIMNTDFPEALVLVRSIYNTRTVEVWPCQECMHQIKPAMEISNGFYLHINMVSSNSSFTSMGASGKKQQGFGWFIFSKSSFKSFSSSPSQISNLSTLVRVKSWVFLLSGIWVSNFYQVWDKSCVFLLESKSSLKSSPSEVSSLF